MDIETKTNARSTDMYDREDGSIRLNYVEKNLNEALMKVTAVLSQFKSASEGSKIASWLEPIRDDIECALAGMASINHTREAEEHAGIVMQVCVNQIGEAYREGRMDQVVDYAADIQLLASSQYFLEPCKRCAKHKAKGRYMCRRCGRMV